MSPQKQHDPTAPSATLWPPGRDLKPPEPLKLEPLDHPELGPRTRSRTARPRTRGRGHGGSVWRCNQDILSLLR